MYIMVRSRQPRSPIAEGGPSEVGRQEGPRRARLGVGKCCRPPQPPCCGRSRESQPHSPNSWSVQSSCPSTAVSACWRSSSSAGFLRQAKHGSAWQQDAMPGSCHGVPAERTEPAAARLGRARRGRRYLKRSRGAPPSLQVRVRPVFSASLAGRSGSGSSKDCPGIEAIRPTSAPPLLRPTQRPADDSPGAPGRAGAHQARTPASRNAPQPRTRP